MTREEHLLTLMAEEACEVGQQATKALRFGLEEVQKDQPLTNAERLRGELIDLLTIWEMLAEFWDHPTNNNFRDEIEAKKAKVEKWLEYSETLGKLD